MGADKREQLWMWRLVECLNQRGCVQRLPGPCLAALLVNHDAFPVSSQSPDSPPGAHTSFGSCFNPYIWSLRFLRPQSESCKRLPSVPRCQPHGDFWLRLLPRLPAEIRLQQRRIQPSPGGPRRAVGRACRWVPLSLLSWGNKDKPAKIQSHVSVMHAHLFGAYFGLMVSWTLYHSSLRRKAEKERSRPISDMFAVLGTLFLWIFWPSFNSALITEEDKKWTAIYNTYFVMATSTIAAFSLSMAASKHGKLSMAHIQNATLAGGVALGFSASNIHQPWIAMVLGLAAGTVSVLGMACLQKHLDPALKIHDTCGVLYTFGLPSLLGGIIHVILILINHRNNLSVFGCSALIEVGALSLSLCLSLVSGLLTGLILTCKLWKTPPVTKYFDDQVYWEFPHLAVGF
ncbi:RH-like protein isoform X2 [Erythrolamprus reginae]|uniref:RH-like protein isoform X2 n=1 Tax=Erythrolamprus reginae TaxID=121349 RepID=UPI00396CE945